MKKYQAPEIELDKIEVMDIITQSYNNDDNDPNDNNDLEIDTQNTSAGLILL